MKFNKLLFLTALCFGLSLSAMDGLEQEVKEQEQSKRYQLAFQDQTAKITEKEYTALKNQSVTVAHMIDDIQAEQEGDEIPVGIDIEKIQAILPLLVCIEEKNTGKLKDTGKLKALLQGKSIEDLVSTLKVANYLDCKVLLDKLASLITKKLDLTDVNSVKNLPAELKDLPDELKVLLGARSCSKNQLVPHKLQCEFYKATLEHSSPQGVVCSPDGKHIITENKDSYKIWNVREATWLATIPKEENVLDQHIEFSEAGYYVCTSGTEKSSRGNIAKVFDLHGKCLGTFKDKRFLKFSIDDSFVCTASSTGPLADQQKVEIYYLDDQGEDGPRSRYLFEPDCWESPEAKLVQGSILKEVLNMSPMGTHFLEKNGNQVICEDLFSDQRHVFTHANQIKAAKFSPDNLQVLTYAGKEIKIWDLHTGVCQTNIQRKDDIVSAKFSPDGKYVLIEDDNVHLYEVDGSCLATIRHIFASTKFSPDSSCFITYSTFSTAVKFWNLEGKCINNFYIDGDGINKVIFSSNGDYVIVLADQEVDLLDKQGEYITPLIYGDEVEFVKFSRDGKHILVGLKDGVRVWELSSINDCDRFCKKGITIEQALVLHTLFRASEQNQTFNLTEPNTSLVCQGLPQKIRKILKRLQLQEACDQDNTEQQSFASRIGTTAALPPYLQYRYFLEG